MLRPNNDPREREPLLKHDDKRSSSSSKRKRSYVPCVVVGLVSVAIVFSIVAIIFSSAALSSKSTSQPQPAVDRTTPGIFDLSGLTKEKLAEHLFIVATYMESDGPAVLWLGNMKTRVSTEEYQSMRADFMHRMYIDTPVPYEANLLQAKSGYFRELRRIQTEIDRRRLDPAATTEDLGDYNSLNVVATKLLLFQDSTSAIALIGAYGGETDLFGHEDLLNPFHNLLIHHAHSLINYDIWDDTWRTNVMDKPYADYTTSDYEITLEMYTRVVDRCRIDLEYLDYGMRRGHRELWASYRENFNSWQYEEIYSVEWADMPYYELVPTTPGQVALKDAIRSQYETYRVHKKQLYDNFNLYYGTKTLGELYPMTYAGTSRVNETIIRDRYEVPSVSPNGPYKDIAGCIPKFPTVEEAIDAYSRGFAFAIDENASPHQVGLDLKAILDGLSTSPDLTAHLTFLNQYMALYRGNDGLVMTDTTMPETIGDQLRMGWAQWDSGASVASVTGSNDIVTTIEPHVLKVGDSVYLMDRRTGHSHSMLPPLSYSVDTFEFDFDPQLSIGDQFTMRDYGLSHFVIQTSSLTLDQLRVAGAGTYTTKLDNPEECVIQPEVDGLLYSQYVVRTVTSISSSGGSWFVTIDESTAPSNQQLSDATYDAQLVFLYKKLTPFRVIAVSNGNQFQLDTPVTDAGLLSDLTKVEVRVGLDTNERLVCESFSSLHVKLGIGYEAVFSEKQYARWNAASFNLERGPGFSAAAGPNTFFWGNDIHFVSPRAYSNYLDIHEIGGHVFAAENVIVADFSSVTPIQASLSFPQTFVEGQATYFEESVYATQADLMFYPQRDVTTIGATNRIYYTIPASGVDTSILVDDDVFVFSFESTERAALLSAGLTSYDGGKHSVVYTVAAKGVEGTLGPYLEVTNSDGTPATFSVNSGPFTATYVVEKLLSKQLHSFSYYVIDAPTSFNIAYSDIMINYNHEFPTKLSPEFNTDQRIDQRITAHPTQHITYAYGSFIIKRMEDTYRTRFNLTYDQFISEGHIKGFLDMIQLDGRLDIPSRFVRLDQFIEYVAAGGDQTKFYLGQEATNSRRSVGEMAGTRHDFIMSSTRERVVP